MTKKIIISKNVLENLYINEKLSTHKIARQFSCDSGVIQRMLREYKIELRQPKRKIIIPRKKLYNLYINKKLSTQKIAKIMNISSCSVYYKLKELGIIIRKKRKLKISKEKLKKLYIDNRLSCSKISKKLGFDRITIFNRLQKYVIKTRGSSEANTIYKKRKFQGNEKLKAYMIGFRLGDLNVKTNTRETIFIKSSTTKTEQLDLIKQVYGGYGHFKVSKGKNDYCMWCNLDKSFSFLLPKEDKIEEWILNNNNCFFSFLAGYSDAEGNFGVYEKRARFRLGSYDKNILQQIADKLNFLGIKTNINLEGKAIIGKHNKDFYRVSINEKNSLLNLINSIKPYIKHKKRSRDMILAEKNILERNKKYDIKDSIMKDKFYVTTPIYYTNSEPHVGSAYTTIAADIFARWHKLKGENVFFLTGTDEHGQKIQEIAEKAGQSPQKFVDKIAQDFIKAFKLLNISNDFFIRTTNKEHEKEVKNILQELYNKNFIYKGKYESYYCVGCEQYLTRSDLADGCCPLHKKEPELRKEEAYLFKLSSFQGKLLKLIKSGEFNILPLKKRNEVISFIESGLQDVSISRLKEKVSWGIELPFDKKHTCFVWVDAFWNYITGLKINNNFKTFWPPNLQLMANDILRVHATIWPALLLALDYQLPKTLFIHGYFTINGVKMSKSLGNFVSLVPLVDKYGADSVRYFLMRNIPFGEDGDFSEKSLIDRNNNELANKLGNLISRISALAEKYGLEKCENKLIKKLKLKEIENLIDNYGLDKALGLIFEFIDECNGYVQENKIWETGSKKQLYELCDSIKAIGILLYPFIPESCEKISKQFGFKLAFSEINKPLKTGKIKKAEILFKKI